jgi:DNA-binding response OmpR family regulator
MDLKVLLVDDDHRYLELLKFALESEGISSQCERSSRRVLDHARTWQPHVIVMDITMPECDGYAVLVGLRADAETQQIPVIMATARSDFAEKQLGRALGAVDYLIKPFSMNDLVKKVREAADALTAKDITVPANDARNS